MTARFPGRAILEGNTVLALGLGACAATFTTLLLAEGAGPSKSLPLAPALPHFDKLLHATAHFVLASLLLWAGVMWPTRRFRLRLGRATAAGFALDVFFGLGVEAVQAWFGQAHGRRYEYADVAANTGGAFLATIAFLVVVKCSLSAYIKGRHGAVESY